MKPAWNSAIGEPPLFGACAEMAADLLLVPGPDLLVDDLEGFDVVARLDARALGEGGNHAVEETRREVEVLLGELAFADPHREA